MAYQNGEKGTTWYSDAVPFGIAKQIYYLDGIPRVRVMSSFGVR